MILKLNRFLKILLFLILIFLSIAFFYSGYQKLTYLEFVYPIKINESATSDSIEKNDGMNSVDKVQSNFEQNLETSTIFENEIVLTVEPNDTFDKMIMPYVRNNQIKQKIINLINKEFDLRKLNVGKKISLFTSKTNKEDGILKIIIPLSFNTDLVVKKNANDSYSINKINIPINIDTVAQKYTITKSVFADGQKANVPLAILAEVIRLYSFDIDFQRDIKKGNKLEILYQTFYNQGRNEISYGDIQYVNLIFKKNNLEYFIFKTSEGFLDYFNKEGKNVRKALMKTPLDGARISSSYGKRKHPILGYNKFHQGVDFAAPTGTPVYAAGNGTIEYAGRNGGYGKYIRIRHNNSYKTAYAHLNAFKKGISKGARVNQGQIIAYVGSSGRSTGPHLHYEVIYKGKTINPMKMKLPSGKVLKGTELKTFIKSSKTLYSNFLYYLFE